MIILSSQMLGMMIMKKMRFIGYRRLNGVLVHVQLYWVEQRLTVSKGFSGTRIQKKPEMTPNYFKNATMM